MQHHDLDVEDAAADLDHVFAPSFSLQRGLPVFVADEKNEAESGCNKYSRLHSFLTPGLFTFFCPHGICVAFILMMATEGPSTAFKFFYTRFITGTSTGGELLSV